LVRFLYQLLRGHPPFAAAQRMKTIKLLLETDPRQPRTVKSKIAAICQQSVLKCLGKIRNADIRPHGTGEDLERWLNMNRFRRAAWNFRARQKVGAAQSYSAPPCRVLMRLRQLLVDHLEK